jgi:hypothetical protein
LAHGSFDEADGGQTPGRRRGTDGSWMNAFNHFTVFFSIIIGLTVTRLLSGFAELIRNTTRVRWDATYVLWSLLVLLSAAYEWWVIQRWQSIESVQFFAFLFISIRPALLYFIAHLLIPDPMDDAGGVDLGGHFMRMRRWIVPLLAIFYLLSVADTALKGGAYFARVFPHQWPFTVMAMAILLGTIVVHRKPVLALLAAAMIVRLVLVVVFV